MDFFIWLFADHYIISTLIWPTASIAWGIYADSGARVLGASAWWVAVMILRWAVK